MIIPFPEHRIWTRRKVLLAALAAPAIIRSGLLMLVKPLPRQVFSPAELARATFTRDGNYIVAGKVVSPQQMAWILQTQQPMEALGARPPLPPPSGFSIVDGKLAEAHGKYSAGVIHPDEDKGIHKIWFPGALA